MPSLAAGRPRVVSKFPSLEAYWRGRTRRQNAIADTGASRGYRPRTGAEGPGSSSSRKSPERYQRRWRGTEFPCRRGEVLCAVPRSGWCAPTSCGDFTVLPRGSIKQKLMNGTENKKCHVCGEMTMTMRGEEYRIFKSLYYPKLWITLRGL